MGLSEEALSRERGHAWGGAVDQLTQERYVAVAQEVLSRMSPEERLRLVDALRVQARRQDVKYPGLHQLQALDDPATLGGLFGHLRLNAPGLLEQLLRDTEFYEPVLGGMDELARGGAT